MTMLRVAGGLALIEWRSPPAWIAFVVVAIVVALEVRSERRRRAGRSTRVPQASSEAIGAYRRRRKPGMTLPFGTLFVAVAAVISLYAVIFLAWWLWP